MNKKTFHLSKMGKRARRIGGFIKRVATNRIVRGAADIISDGATETVVRRVGNVKRTIKEKGKKALAGAIAKQATLGALEVGGRLAIGEIATGARGAFKAAKYTARTLRYTGKSKRVLKAVKTAKKAAKSYKKYKPAVRLAAKGLKRVNRGLRALQSARRR